MANDTAGETALHQRPHPLWWAYFALLLVMFVLGFVELVLGDFFATLRATLLSAALLSHDAVCIVGLYAFIRSIPLFTPAFWRIMLTLVVARIFVSASFFVPNLFPWEASREQYAALGGLAMLIVWAPMLVALWRYAFKSPHVWNRATAA